MTRAWSLGREGRLGRARFIGGRFLGGVVLHTGPAAFSLGDRITAAPISTLGA